MLFSIHNQLVSKWTLSSTFFHLLALGFILFWHVQHTSAPKKFVVQAVRIHEFQQPSPKPVVEFIHPKEEIIACAEAISTEATIEDIPLKAAEPDSILAPEPKQVQTPPAQPKPSVNKKVEPVKKAPVPKKTEAPKKKEEPVRPTQQPQKTTPKEIQQKAQEKAKQNEQKRALEQEKQQNIQAALKSLDKASSKSKSIVAVASEPVSSAKQIGTLRSENIQSISTSGEEEYAPKEARYVAELIHRLKLALKLPEHGEVKVRLTVTRTGSVQQLSIQKSSSALNKTSIEQKLKNLALPAFGMSFAGEESHTFVLILTNAS